MSITTTTEPDSDGTADRPFHLRGNYAPVVDELTVHDLEVTGAVPRDLDGRYLRNGPNPVTGESGHWFLGDGMLHGVRLRGGTAEWYRNRYVRTPLLDDPDKPVVDMETGHRDMRDSKANTHVVGHAGRILALEEGHLPYEVTPDLDTVGPHDFGGALEGSFTAHPKICPVTGEMIGFGYSVFPPYLTYHRVSADGALVHSEPIDIPAPVMMHDFNVTAGHVVFMDLPVVFDLDLAMAGTMPFAFRPENGARLGVMSRDGGNADIEWLEIDPCYVFHPLNAFDDGALVVVDVARYPSMWADGSSFDEAASLWRWEIDVSAGAVTETQLDDRPIEFGRVADTSIAQPYRYGYAVGAGGGGAGQDGQRRSAILKYDLTGGGSTAHDFGPARTPGEFVFAPRAGAAGEDDGYLIGYVHDDTDDRTALVILAADDVASDPLATVHLPRRVPFGFHGSWFPD